MTVPRLQVRRKLIEKDPQTGYVSLNLSERSIKILLGVAGFLFVGLLGWVANIIQLLQVFR